MNSTDPIDIGSRLELMVDDFLIARLNGAEHRLNRPVPQDISLVTDAPWEGNACGYFTVFQDNGLYRMYYRGQQYDMTDAKLIESPHPMVICYAESDDGIHWFKPELGLVEFNGSTKNNIILHSEQSSFRIIGFAPFKDTNPNARPEEQYKAWIVGTEPRGLHPLKSPDGLHWTTMSEGAVITAGEFDSHNTVFWDGLRGEYRDYHRNESRIDRTGEEPYSAQTSLTGQSLRGSRYGRDILTTTSKNFAQWSEPEYLSYTTGRTDQLYTNSIIPYFRAPHLFIGMPGRYIDRGWSEAIEDLPELDERRRRANVGQYDYPPEERFGSALTDCMFMSSRDGQTFSLWPESFIRPGLNWTYGDNFAAWGLVSTRSAIEGAPDELSVYVNEGYWRGNSLNLRRHTLRLDGFASVQAPLVGGEMITRPIIFDGRELVLNFSASAAGSIRVEILRDQMEIPVQGFELSSCVEVLGDDLERVVRWSEGSDLSRLANTPVRLRFALKDVDLYSMQFR